MFLILYSKLYVWYNKILSTEFKQQFYKWRGCVMIKLHCIFLQVLCRGVNVGVRNESDFIEILLSLHCTRK